MLHFCTQTFIKLGMYEWVIQYAHMLQHIAIEYCLCVKHAI